MTPGGYGAGWIALLAIFVPMAVTCRTMRKRWVPDWNGSIGWLADAVLYIAGLTALAQVLGLVGGFQRWPMAAASVGIGVMATWYSRRSPRQAGASALPKAAPLWARLATAVSMTMAAVVVAQWIGRTIERLRQGVADVDSLDYHGPFAVRFVQLGSVIHLELSRGSATYYPANGELIQGLAILPFHRDLLLPFVNLGWLALALLGGWCSGRRFGVAPVTLAGTALLLSSPSLIEFNAGTAGNDVAVVALTLATVALLLHTRWRPVELAIAGAAAGLALGTKLNVVPPVGLLVLGVPMALWWKGRRPGDGGPPPNRLRRQTIAWVAPGLGLGALWYVRNAVVTGNPLPWLRLGVGPVRLPTLQGGDAAQELGVPIYRYLLEGHHGTEIGDGLVFGLGRAWPVLLVLPFAGLILSVLLGADRLRLLAGFGLVIALTYAVNPISAGGFEGVGGFFQINLRYLAPALAVGMVLVALLPALQRWWLQAVVVGVCSLGTIATFSGYSSTGPDNHVSLLAWPWLAFAAASGLLVAGLVDASGREPRSDRFPPCGSAPQHW
jgi:hypothetical protein